MGGRGGGREERETAEKEKERGGAEDKEIGRGTVARLTRIILTGSASTNRHRFRAARPTTLGTYSK